MDHTRIPTLLCRVQHGVQYPLSLMGGVQWDTDIMHDQHQVRKTHMSQSYYIFVYEVLRPSEGGGERGVVVASQKGDHWIVLEDC